MSSNYPVLPAGPPMGEIVRQEVLENMVLTGRTFGTLRLAQAFAGQTDPTVIWQSLIGDKQDAYFFMRELEEKDEDIGTHIDTLKLAVIGQPQSVSPGDDSAGAQEVADHIEDQIERIPNWHNVIYQLLESSPYGVSIAEIMYGFDFIDKKYSVVIDRIEDRPQELFTFNPRWLPQIGQLRFLRDVYDMTGGELVPESKFITFSHNMRSGNRRGRPVLRNVYWPSWFKRQTLRMWLRFAEKGPGTAVVKYTAGNDDQASKALEAAENIIEKVAVAVPENFEIVAELLNSARATSPDTYAKLVERMEQAIARRIVGQTLTSRSGASFGSSSTGGSRALGQVHQDIFYLIFSALAKELQCCVNDRIVKPLVYWNFGPNAPMPKWKILSEEEEDLQSEITVDNLLQQMGYPLTQSYVSEKYGRPTPEDGDVVLERMQPATALGGGLDATHSTVDARTEQTNNPPDPTQGGNSEYSESPRTLDDVKRMIAQLKANSFETFKARILALTEEARTHQALASRSK